MAGGIDGRGGFAEPLADRGDAAVAHGDLAGPRRPAAAVDDEAAGDLEIERHAGAHGSTAGPTS